MTDPLSTVSTRRTPQSEKAAPGQEVNHAGGYAFALDAWSRLRRFLTLGVDGGTYYVNAGDLSRENAQVVFDLAKTDGERTVDVIREVSLSGRAPRQNPALFALAILAAEGDEATRRSALTALPEVARTGTHLFLFAGYVEQFRGWGRGLRRGVAAWYEDKPAGAVAFQAAKYAQRGGWSHRDLLRLAHPAADTAEKAAIFDWICGRGAGNAFTQAVDAVRSAGIDELLALIDEHGLSWEMLPSDALNDARVWEALLDRGVPATALMRQLPRLTRLGLISELGGRTAEIADLLRDPERLAKARVHPVNVLVALRTYASGYGARGRGEWEPNPRIVAALDDAFYAAFGQVESAGRRTMLALDVSGSMTQTVSGLPLSCREASAALALVTAATEPEHTTVGFTAAQQSRLPWRRQGPLSPLPIGPRQRLDDAIRAVSDLPFGATDCALPMIHALERGLEVDTFVVFTDNETWHGAVHPHQALDAYRRQTGIDARLIVVAMTATPFSIADPDDPGMLDVSGFDASVPNLISAFSRGDV